MGIYAGPRDEFNQRSGAGKAVYNNGDLYEGDFFEGKKHGQGHYTFKSQGLCEVDKLIVKAWNVSQGIETAETKHKDGSDSGGGEKTKRKSTSASIRMTMLTGSNQQQTESREAFVKRFAKEIQVGVAIVDAALEYGEYPCYHGDYHLGLRTGQGLMKNRDGSIYKGDWLNNKRHGKGMLFFVNGDVYSGQWSHGQKHGFGTYRFVDGGEFRGEWANGVFVEGQWIMRDGNFFEGKFDKKNRPCDPAGTLHFPAHRMAVPGVFSNGVWTPSRHIFVDGEVPADERTVVHDSAPAANAAVPVN